MTLKTPIDPDDPAAWDAFVAAANPGSYLQLSGWARVKAVNGWTATRLRTSPDLQSGEAAPVGAQILLRRPRPHNARTPDQAQVDVREQQTLKYGDWPSPSD